jgi:nitrogen fixation protein FixH
MKQRELTGRTVLIYMVAFFGVIGAANAFLIHAATSTFGGVEVESSYRAGLKFQQELDAARAQDALNWSVSARLARRAAGDAELSLTVRDRNGVPLSGLEAAARLTHPADSRRDHAILLKTVGAGRFAGLTEAETAQWDLLIDLTRDGKTVFRSRSRIDLRSTP